MSENSFYITTPIYYVNDVPHIGHAYTTILADVLARYHRLLGDPTFFLTGTDEHGQKVQNAANKNNRTPQEHCDLLVKRFQDLWVRLGITNDDFIRTTQQRHKDIVAKNLQILMDKGLIYSAPYKGWYCVPCERFFTEKDLINGKCPDCGRDVEEIEEKNYFFKMSAFQQWLIDYIEANPKFIQPENRRQETLGFLKHEKLDDLCISRPKKRLAWGIELPFDKDYVTYVWFDALVNYISTVGYLADDEKFKKWWPASVHLIGKDILRQHTVFWPIMLRAMDLPMPKTVFAHGWWLVGDQKMSKSLHNVVNPFDMIDKYGVDAFRYYLMAAMNLGMDASFTEKLFADRYNAELANDLGNLASRVVSMINKNCNAQMPPYSEPGEDEKELVETTLGAVKFIGDAVNNFQLDRGIAAVLNAVRVGNKYFDAMKPWALAKSGDTAKLNAVLRHTAETLRIVSGLLYPVMPTKMTELRRALAIPEDSIVPNISRLSIWRGLTDGATIAKPSPLFARVVYKEEDNDLPLPKDLAKKCEVKEMPVNVVTIEDVGKVSLKTAVICEAEPVPNADKLLKLIIKIGDEKRQIVSGIAKYYTPEQLVGKTIIVIANLKPTVLRGVESAGMLLAAKSGDTLRLITTDGEIASGASVG
ncbi:MAG: methionine--tRNA ligase [Victivallales bacterium]|nr:methionine--tRNA ligase [Victivallales bacterium]